LLALLAVIGAAVYVGAVSILDRRLFGDVRDLLRAAMVKGLPADIEAPSPLS
jgi:hypothetical protein